MTLSPKTQAFFEKLLDLGGLEGSIGKQTLHSEIQVMEEIVLKILAGAKLDINIKELTPPDKDLLEELNTLRKEAEVEANQLNAKAGANVAAMP